MSTVSSPNNSSSFTSATSGTNTTYVSCNASLDLDMDVLEDSSFDENTDPDDFQSLLNAEALDALEGSLKLQLELLYQQHQQFDCVVEESIAYTEQCNEEIMEKTRRMREDADHVEEETREVIKQRDQALQDLRGVEQAFSDVHRKYERSKQVLENLKQNEGLLKQRDEEFQLLISSRDQKSEAFKEEMEDTLEKMYTDFQAKIALVDADNSKLAALRRRAELRVETLESELAHKQRENAQLNTLMDDLIGRSAHNGI